MQPDAEVAMRRVADSPIIVRAALPIDAEGLVALASEVGQEPGRYLLVTGEWRSAADERRYLKAIRRSLDAAVYVAEVDGTLAGRLSLARDPHPSSRHVGDLGLMVAAAHRRRGIGRALLEQAVRWAGSVGIRKLELHVFPWNAPAIQLYTAFGFVQEGLRIGHYERDGEFVDAILMALHVEPTEDR